ncbi:sex hormone-binding globulin [Halichoeres trimaculatus]|uniref:sex hormone-binding globulin n=1 Tax=Halichoeres trimaculatus TaxID=147232 RepID=UPI003D9EEE69
MAVFWRALTGGVLLALLGWGAEIQGNSAGKKEVSGSATVNLGQERDIWRPLIHTTINLSEIRSIKSSFQLRTFDPEGVIFYGDTKKGQDWFVLSLKDGFPLMQISKEDMVVSVTGGPKLDDGKWHTLEVSNEGKFVILDVDDSGGLVVGMLSKTEEALSGELRLALGGVLIDTEKLIVQFQPQLDGCVRDGSWLDLTEPWETEVEELWPCYQDVKPGSYFPGTGLALFNTSVFPIKADGGVTFEVWADFSNIDGTIFSIKSPKGEISSASFNKTAKELRVFHYPMGITEKTTFDRMGVTFLPDMVSVNCSRVDMSLSTSFNVSWGDSESAFSTFWTEAQIAFGGLLGNDEDNAHDPQFLTGCLEKIQVQGQDLDLDLAIKRQSISSHSCPT